MYSRVPWRIYLRCRLLSKCHDTFCPLLIWIVFIGLVLSYSADWPAFLLGCYNSSCTRFVCPYLPALHGRPHSRKISKQPGILISPEDLPCRCGSPSKQLESFCCQSQQAGRHCCPATESKRLKGQFPRLPKGVTFVSCNHVSAKMKHFDLS